ncbi:MAG: hypothetical protein ACTSWP_03270 [Candidatus Freyarchaeota archaeon]
MTVGREVLSSELESLDFRGERVYCMVNEAGICIVAISSEELPEVLVKLLLEDVSDKIMRDYGYGEMLKSWDGRLDVFEELSSYLKELVSRPFMEVAFQTFILRVGLEGAMLYDLEKGDVLFSVLPSWFGSRRKLAAAFMISNFANKLSNEMGGGGVDTVIFGGERRWIVTLIRDSFCLMALLAGRGEYNIDHVVEIADILLDFALKMVKRSEKR